MPPKQPCRKCGSTEHLTMFCGSASSGAASTQAAAAAQAQPAAPAATPAAAPAPAAATQPEPAPATQTLAPEEQQAAPAPAVAAPAAAKACRHCGSTEHNSMFCPVKKGGPPTSLGLGGSTTPAPAPRVEAPAAAAAAAAAADDWGAPPAAVAEPPAPKPTPAEAPAPAPAPAPTPAPAPAKPVEAEKPAEEAKPSAKAPAACRHCGSTDHPAFGCPTKKGTTTAAPPVSTQPTTQSTQGSSPQPTASAPVRACTHCGSTEHKALFCPQKGGAAQAPTEKPKATETDATEKPDGPKVEAKVSAVQGPPPKAACRHCGSFDHISLGCPNKGAGDKPRTESAAGTQGLTRKQLEIQARETKRLEDQAKAEIARKKKKAEDKERLRALEAGEQKHVQIVDHSSAAAVDDGSWDAMEAGRVAAAAAAEEVARRNAQAVVQVGPPEKPLEYVEWFYSTTRPELYDLFSKLAAADGFVIEGDSLVMKILANNTVDVTNGGQLLQFVFLAERFLQSLTLERGGHAYVVFFDCHRALWNTHPLGLLVREVLRQWLAKGVRTPHVQVENFEDYWSEEWQSFVSRVLPTFILCDDGEEAELLLDNEQAFEDVRFLLHAFLIHSVGGWDKEGKTPTQHAAYISRISFNGLKGEAFVINTDADRKQQVSEMWTAIHDEVIDRAKPEALSRVPPFDGVRPRLIPLGTAVLATLRDLDERDLPFYQDLAKVTLAAAALSYVIPVEWRSQRLTTEAPDQLIPYCDVLFRHLSGLASRTVTDCITTVDLFDGRLVHQLLVNSHLNGWGIADLGLPDDLVSDVERIWTAGGHAAASLGKLASADWTWNQLEEGENPNVPNRSSTRTEEMLPAIPPLQEQAFLDLPVDRITPEGNLADIREMSESVREESIDWFYNSVSDESGNPVVASVDKNLDQLEVLASKKKANLSEREILLKERNKQYVAAIEKLLATSMAGGAMCRDGEILAVDAMSKRNKKEKKDTEKKEDKKEDKKVKKVDKKEAKKDKKGDKAVASSPAVPKGKEEKGKKEKEVKKTKAELIQEQNALAKQAQLLDKETKQWQEVKKSSVNAIASAGNKVYYQLVKGTSTAKSRIEGFLKVSNQKELSLEARVFLLETLFEAWKAHTIQTDKHERDYSFAAQCYELVFAIIATHKDLLKETAKESRTRVLDVILALGFRDIANRVAKELSATISNVARSDRHVVGLSAQRFQLTHMGHVLRRKVGEADERVGFRPDPWQKTLMDIVDRDQSALVCAPTSSGKTFISLYAMKRVLKGLYVDRIDEKGRIIPDWDEKDKGLVIFLSPNQQLCQQVRADISAQFKKDFKHGEKTVFGEYAAQWESVENCQVLITTPANFLMLLTSPKHMKWVCQRARYIIVDEVHCIDELRDGAIWERVLMMARCPFLCLSATIGNLDEFHEWLQSIRNFTKEQELERKEKRKEEQKEKSKEDKKKKSKDDRKDEPVHDPFYVAKIPDGVVTKEIRRWSDLQKYVYLPSSNAVRNQWEKTYPKSYRSGLATLHPCARLTTHKLATTGFPGDLSFVPRETVELYDVMHATVNELNLPNYPVANIEAFSPESFFNKLEVTELTQELAHEYERAVKSELQKWASSDDSGIRSLADKTLQSMRAEVDKKVSDAQEWSDGPAVDSAKFVTTHLMDLLTDLAHSGRAPALLFNFDQGTCESLGKYVVEFLEGEEHKYKQTDAYKALVLKAERAKLQQAQNEKLKESAVHVGKGGDKDDKDKAKADTQANKSAGLDIVDVEIPDVNNLPEFTFLRVTEGEGMGQDEYDDLVKPLSKRYTEDHILMRALKRGIGVHHNGLPAVYRRTVEILFRFKHIKFVFCTETLALGVHMPCRTVVFAGDDIRLNPLQYRQMSGRAGRRGFDLLGHVVFFGVPDDKITRLLTSDLPRIKGHTPLTPALFQRELILLERARDPVHGFGSAAERYIRNRLQCMVRTPLLPQYQVQAKWCMAALQDFFVKEGILTEGGTSGIFADAMSKQGISGGTWHPFIASMLEPSNIVIWLLIKEGILTGLCDEYQPYFEPNARVGTTETPELAVERQAKNDKVIENLLLFLCHVFSRKEIHRSVRRDERLDKGEGSAATTHTGWLASLKNIVKRKGREGKDAHIAMQDIERSALESFTTYVMNVAKEVKSDWSHSTMPLSGKGLETQTVDVSRSSFLQSLEEGYVPNVSRNSFAALSGRGDFYDTFDEMQQSAFNGFFLDSDVFPCFELRDTRLSEKVHVNAVVFDYQHSVKQDECVTYNGIPHRESWLLMRSFYDALVRLCRILAMMEGWHGRTDKNDRVDGSTLGDSFVHYWKTWVPEKEKEKFEGGRYKFAPSKTLHALIELGAKFEEAYVHTDSQRMSVFEAKSSKGRTARKPPRPSLVKHTPGRGRGRGVQIRRVGRR